MNLLEALNIPLCQKQRIPVKMLVEQLQPNVSNKKILESHISSLHLVGYLNEQTIKIRPYKDENYSYQVIYVIEVILKKNDSLLTVAELIHSSFPEPTLLVLENEYQQYISIANKRINKNDNSRTIVDDVNTVQIKEKLECLNLKKVSCSDLKSFCDYIYQILYKIKVFNLTNVFPNSDHDYKVLLKQYEQIHGMIKVLKSKYKQADSVAEKMQIDDELYDAEIKLKNLLSNLKEGDVYGKNG